MNGAKQKSVSRERRKTEFSRHALSEAETRAAIHLPMAPCVVVVPIDPVQVGEPEAAAAPPPPPPLGKLRSLKVPKEPPSRSLARASDLRAHAKGAPVGMASSVFGFGTVHAPEPLIEVRARLDANQIEPVYLTEAVLVRALQKLRAAKARAVKARRG